MSFFSIAQKGVNYKRAGKGISQREGEGVQTSFEGLPPKAKKSEEREGRPRKGEKNMSAWKHKYIFYFYPTEEEKGFFRFFEHSKKGKELAKRWGRKYDYEKLY